MGESSKPQFKVGDEIYVRDPGNFVPGATCIVGPVTAHEFMNGAHRYEVRDEGHPGTDKLMWFREDQIKHRIGTPLSQLSGRPGHPGYAEFVRIAKSWGYP